MRKVSLFDVLEKVTNVLEIFGQWINEFVAQACDSGGLRKPIVINAPGFSSIRQPGINWAPLKCESLQYLPGRWAVGESTGGGSMDEKAVWPSRPWQGRIPKVEQRKLAGQGREHRQLVRLEAIHNE